MSLSSSSPVSSGGRATRRRRLLERYVRERLDEEHEKVSAALLRHAVLARIHPRPTAGYGRRGLRLETARRFRSLLPAVLARVSRHPVPIADLERQRRREDPYQIENIAHAGFPTIIVLDGGGYSDGAREWLLAHSGNRNLVDV